MSLDAKVDAISQMYMIGGFFKCLGELRQSGERGPALESSLPTVDVDGEHISPLSE